MIRAEVELVTLNVLLTLRQFVLNALTLKLRWSVELALTPTNAPKSVAPDTPARFSPAASLSLT